MKRETWKPINFAVINSLCLDRWPSLLGQWLPDGVRRGKEWVALNPTRQDRHLGSFLINIKNGCWSDFATGDRGGDPISLYAYLNGLSQGQAAHALHKAFGARHEA